MQFGCPSPEYKKFREALETESMYEPDMPHITG